MAEHVDEAGRDGVSGCVDRLAGAGGAQVADRFDAIGDYADIGGEAFAATAVVDRAVADD
jgi:hypothetical protein